jgi:hypothetical protein
MSTILVKVGKRFYKARVNPKPSLLDDDRYAHLCRLYARCSKLGQLRRMITLERQIRKQERKNPLSKRGVTIALAAWRRAQR